MTHTEFVEALGVRAQEIGAVQLAEEAGILRPHMHSVLSLQKNIPQAALDYYKYRRIPYYIKEGTTEWPIDLATKFNNRKRVG